MNENRPGKPLSVCFFFEKYNMMKLNALLGGPVQKIQNLKISVIIVYFLRLYK